MVFLSYSKSDLKWREHLLTHLSGRFDNQLKDYVWADKYIKTGDDWNDELEKNRNNATVAVLLVSPAYLASEFIKENELNYFLEKNIRIVWFLLADCAWDVYKLAQKQCANPLRAERLVPLQKCKSKVDDIFNARANDIYHWAMGQDNEQCTPSLPITNERITLTKNGYNLTDSDGKKLHIPLKASMNLLDAEIKKSNEPLKLIKDLTAILKAKPDEESKNLLAILDLLDYEYSEKEVGANATNARDETIEKGLEPDDIFGLLSNIDFKRQQKSFESYINTKERQFFAFALRADGVRGQRWLLNQLINKHLPDNNHIILGSEENRHADMVIDNLLKNLGCNTNDSEFDTKCMRAVKAFMKRVEIKDQVIIFKNSYYLVNAGSFNLFHDKFIKPLTAQCAIDEPPHRIVIFFVEENHIAYQAECGMKCFYLDSASPADVNDFKKEKFSKKEKLDVVVLNSIDSITYPMIEEWLMDYLAGSPYGSMTTKITEDFYNTNCQNGNPENVLYQISKQFKYQSQCLKY